MTYGELSNLGIVHTKNLSLLTGTETETRDEIHDEENYAGSSKGIGKSSDGVGQLVSQLNIVVIEPTSCDDSVAIEVRYVITKIVLASIPQRVEVKHTRRKSQSRYSPQDHQ